MARRAGSADLPLHGGHVPKWLADRMTRLGAVISEAIVHHYGRDELLRRLAHPFWFQSFGCVMGMDWHSSGITTSVIGALKRGLVPLQGELGIYVCGGRGAHSRKTPTELVAIGERVGFDGDALATASRLVAKVDSAAVQDGFDLYLHGFIVTAADRGPKDFPQLLLTPGVGARTVRALAMVAEVMHGAPSRFTDPARFSLAHGGKDRHPFPVPLKVYDETIAVLKSAVRKARLGNTEELGALQRLDEQARQLEREATGPSVQEVIAQERERSHQYGGRSVFGWEPPPEAERKRGPR